MKTKRGYEYIIKEGFGSVPLIIFVICALILGFVIMAG